jgi:hypothetical protein
MQKYKSQVNKNGTKDDNNYFVKKVNNKNIVILFDKNSIVMKNVIGLPARGASFYQRDREIEKVTEP